VIARNPQGGDLQIESEAILLELPRGDRGEVLRVTHTTATTVQGKRVAWHGIREFYTDDDGNKKPGKKGITIRGRELSAVATALAQAAAVLQAQPQQHTRAPGPRPALRPAPTPLAPRVPPQANFGEDPGEDPNCGF
jgi:hypothetical protein